MSENNFQAALDIQDMEQTAGWKLLAQNIQEEINSLKEQKEEIKISNRSAESVGQEYINISQRLAGLMRVPEIIEDIKSRKDK